MSKSRAALFVAIAVSIPTLAIAAEPEPTATHSEYRLSPEQIEQVLADAARKREATDGGVQVAPSAPESPPPAVHGEVGVSIGTGGHRSVFGTAVMGLPGNGSGILSVGSHHRSDDYHYYPPN